MNCFCGSFFLSGNGGFSHEPPNPVATTTFNTTINGILAVNFSNLCNAGRTHRRAILSVRFQGNSPSILICPSFPPIDSSIVSLLNWFSDLSTRIVNNNSASTSGCDGGGAGGGLIPVGGDGQGGCEDGSYYVDYYLFILFFIFVCSCIFGRQVGGRFLFPPNWDLLFVVLGILGCLCCGFNFTPATALASVKSPYDNENKKIDYESVVWEVKGGRWTKLIPDSTREDDFVVCGRSQATLFHGILPHNLWLQCRKLMVQLMLPEGFPQSVTSDYLNYCLWRGLQGIASQISGVLATQSLLFTVGLGKGVIPTAAAINWVLKDGIGYASKIFLSKYGRHFDVNPKGWRLFADLLENIAYGLEVLTPTFPHLFVMIGAAAGVGRSTAALIQDATKSCFYTGFAAQRNFAEIIAKGEAQGMVSKSIGILLAIPLANFISCSTPLAFISFGVLTLIHMFCNFKSYQSIQLKTLNSYRASLVFSEYLLSGQIPSIKEVNAEEPLFPALAYFNVNNVLEVEAASLSLSADAKDAAAKIVQRLQLGSKLSDVVNTKQDVLALFNLYQNEGYILVQHKGKYCVIVKESSGADVMLKSLFHVSYLYWLERQMKWREGGAVEECGKGGRLRLSLEYAGREFEHAKSDGQIAGWSTHALIATPLPNRIRPPVIVSTATSR